MAATAAPRLSLALLFGSMAAGCSEYELKRPAEAEPAEPVDTSLPVVYDPPPIEQEDVWVLEEIPTDVLVFGDTSGSMAIELETMGEKISELIAGLEAYTDEWQLLAVTGPSGCGVNGVLTPGTADYEALFAAGLLTPPGEDEVDEWGLYNAAMAVDQTDLGECNEGFLREGARLHIIYLSDEADHSPAWDSGDPLYWITYLDQVSAKKGGLAEVRMSAITGPLPDGCDGAEPGLGYADAAGATGGVVLSICDSWYTQITSLVDISAQTATFTLSQPPVVETLIVSVNDLRREGDWSYDSGANAISFSDGVPVTGDKVSVLYQVADTSG